MIASESIRQSRTSLRPMLQGVRVEGDLRGLAFEARVEQHFRNIADCHVELVWSLPLPHGAVLLGTDVLLGDRRLEGSVMEAHASERLYEEAIADGNAAVQLERNADGTFTLQIGNIAPDETCVVTLRYAQLLRFEQGGLRLALPSVIAPRYGDPIADAGLQPHQVRQHDAAVEYPLDVILRLHGDLATARVASPSHAIRVVTGPTAEGRVGLVTLAQRGALDRDVVLVADGLIHDSFAVLARDSVAPGHVAALGSFRPRVVDTAAQPLTVKILLDCSGSMAGDSTAAAKRALHGIVAQMTPEDRFTLSRFGQQVEHRTERLWACAPSARAAARRWIDAVDADMGGTKMAAALQSTTTLANGTAADILLVTDGQIEALEKTIAVVLAGGHRVFAVGIGTAPVESHLRRLTEATGGACDFIAPGEAVEPAVLRMFARLRCPRLFRARVEWPGNARPVWSESAPTAVFDGDTVSVLALLADAPVGEARLLGALQPDGPELEIARALLSPVITSSDMLPRLVADARVKALSTNRDTDEAARLAVAYQLVTAQTRFLFVHARADGAKATDMPVLHKVAQMTPAGWSGAGRDRLDRCGRLMDHAHFFADAGAHDFFAEFISEPMLVRSRDANRRSGGVPLLAPSMAPPAELRADTPPPPAIAGMLHTPGYIGLSPWGLSARLQSTPLSTRPVAYRDLAKLFVGSSVIDWLELDVAGRFPVCADELYVVAAFVRIMSDDAVRRAFEGCGDLAAALAAITAADHPTPLQQILAEIAAALVDMQAEAWPAAILQPVFPDR